MVTTQWNFLHIFLSSIPPVFLGFISKCQIFFEKLALFRVRDNFAISIVSLYGLLTILEWLLLNTIFYTASSVIPVNVNLSRILRCVRDIVTNRKHVCRCDKEVGTMCLRRLGTFLLYNLNSWAHCCIVSMLIQLP